MGRFRSAAVDHGGESGIDMSPLIDCVFILLIFFIVTTSFVEETGVEVVKPQAASASRLEKTSILLALTDKGQVVYGGRDIGISGVQPLIKRMRRARTAVRVIHGLTRGGIRLARGSLERHMQIGGDELCLPLATPQLEA